MVYFEHDLHVNSPVVFKCVIAVLTSRIVSAVSSAKFGSDETKEPRGTVVPRKLPSFQFAFSSIWTNKRQVFMSVYHSHSKILRLNFM